MTCRKTTLIHINENLNNDHKNSFLHCMTVRHGITKSEVDLDKPHLIFINYDQENHSPHDLVRYARRCGVHAQLIDL